MRISKILSDFNVNTVSFSKSAKNIKQITQEQEKINPMLSQQLVGVAKWAATKKIYNGQPAYFQECDLDKVKRYVLLNNALLSADTSPNIKSSELNFILTPVQKPKSSYASRNILIKMIQNTISESEKKPLEINGNKYIIEQSFYDDNGEYFGSLECDYAISNTAIENFLDTIFNLKLSEEEFNKIKQETLRDFNSTQGKTLRQISALKQGEKELTFQDYKNVTFEDIKKAYEELKNNSKCQIALTMPNAEFKKTGNELLKTIETKIPKMQTYQVATTMNLIKQDAEFTSKATGEKGLNKYYTISDSNTLKDYILYELIKKAVNRSEKNYGLEWLYCSISQNPQNKTIQLRIEDKKMNTQKQREILDGVIADLCNKTQEKQDFETLKSDLKWDIAWDISSNYSKSNILLKRYSDINPKYSDYIRVLNSITPKDLQECAKKYFSSPCITEVHK